jgi:adenylate kinase
MTLHPSVHDGRVDRGDLATTARIVMVGPPGSGKSSQGRELAGRLGVPHLSSGDLLRDEIRAGSALGARVEGELRAGRLVSDSIVDDLFTHRLALSESGFVLDGYPRTRAQAHHLLAVSGSRPPNLLVQLLVPDAVVMNRLGRRAQCARCGVIVAGEPSPACRVCGGELQRRADDRDEVVRARLEQFHAEREVLLDALRDVAFRVDIDGNRTSAEIAHDLWRLVGPRPESRVSSPAERCVGPRAVG